VKIAVVSSNDRQATDIVRLLRERSQADEVDVIPGLSQALAAGAGATTPDVLVLEAPAMGEGDLDQLERLSHVHPRLAFIVLSPQTSPEFLMRAMRAGVREVLPLPLNSEALSEAVRRIEEKRGSQAQAHGKVLAFISCKGGSGATFLATNLAYALATLKNKRVALIDLNLQFGDASLFVSDQKPGGTIADISQQIHRLDASFLQASMLNVTPNFSVLAAPEDPAQGVGDNRRTGVPHP